MENKYFIPSKEDIRVGYECHVQIIENAQWMWDVVIDENWKCEENNIYEYLELGNVRVPYLTKEQIEAEGWVHEGGTFTRQDYLFELYKLEYWELNQNTKIYRKNHIRDGSGRFDWRKIFDGKIPSINEFRTLCKWLEIK